MFALSKYNTYTYLYHDKAADGSTRNLTVSGKRQAFLSLTHTPLFLPSSLPISFIPSHSHSLTHALSPFLPPYLLHSLTLSHARTLSRKLLLTNRILSFHFAIALTGARQKCKIRKTKLL